MIYVLEIWDIIIIRVLVGMYFVSKYISKEIDIVVIYFGEGFDELC